MSYVIKRDWAPASMTPGGMFRPLRRFVERLLETDRTPIEDLPQDLKKDLGLLDGRPSRNRTDAYWSDHKRHGDWMRSGPL
ncbi:MAG TPA: hypothetical protein DIC56_20815 [Rhizobium sp.]|nr:hypothetical protein [Rhizobium sp.]